MPLIKTSRFIYREDSKEFFIKKLTAEMLVLEMNDKQDKFNLQN
jgi:hypothetical protein